MIHYYARRAAEYEQIYQRPERQADLRVLESMVVEAFRDQTVLEVACGTGYWTQFIARGARSVLATDINREMLHIACRKEYGRCAVSFLQADAYSLAGVDDGTPVTGQAAHHAVHPIAQYSAAFCGFWWSHVPRDRRVTFLQVLHAHLQEGAQVIAIDNQYVPGSSTPISRTDAAGNTYQTRTLRDGSQPEVLKNFSSAQELAQVLAPFAAEMQYVPLTYYWWVRYRVRAGRVGRPGQPARYRDGLRLGM